MRISLKIIILLIVICSINIQKLHAEQKIKIGLLVPLSGKQSDIGKSILQSVRLAINKIDNPNIEILPKDTKNDPLKTLTAAKKLRLDAVIWVITKQNPLKKKPYLSTKTRMSLSKGMIKSQKKIFVEYLDDKIKSRNTFDLLNFLKKKNKKIKLFFLIGADNLIKFHKWNKWEKIPELAKIIVFARPNYSIRALNSIASKKLKKRDWMYINSKKMNISSSLIRKF